MRLGVLEWVGLILLGKRWVCGPYGPYGRALGGASIPKSSDHKNDHQDESAGNSG